MTTYVQFTDRVTDQLLAGLKRVEGAVTTSTGKVAGRTPRLPLADKLPLAGKLPSVRELTEANYAIVERLVSAQKEYALNVLSSVTRAAESAPAPKPRARKAAASS